jgi:hypothetical protein
MFLVAKKPAVIVSGYTVKLTQPTVIGLSEVSCRIQTGIQTGGDSRRKYSSTETTLGDRLLDIFFCNNISDDSITEHSKADNLQLYAFWRVLVAMIASGNSLREHSSTETNRGDRLFGGFFSQLIRR